MEKVANVLNNSRDVAAKNYAHVEACSMAKVINLRSRDSQGQKNEPQLLKKTKGYWWVVLPYSRIWRLIRARVIFYINLTKR